MKQTAEVRPGFHASVRALGPGATRPATEEPRSPSLREIGRSLVEGRWIVAGSAAVAGALAAAYLAVANPVYRSTALVQIDERAERAPRVEDLAGLLEPRGTVASEIGIMRSRSILGEVVDQLRLDVEARPRWAPVVGAALARRHAGADPAPPPLAGSSPSRFAWGGERIVVDRLEVPPRLGGVPLTLVALPDRGYRVTAPDGALVAEGRVGAPASPGPAMTVALLVTELVARPGTEFVLRKHSRENVVTALREELYVEEQGKDTGMVSLELEGRDPARVAAILTALTAAYLRENEMRSAADAARTLAFLEAQLPRLKSRLDQAEQALNAFRRKARTVDLPEEAKATVERAAEMERAVAGLQSSLAQLRQRYSDGHPDVIAATRALEAARQEQGGVTPHVTRFPDRQLTAARLTRDVAVATDLYLVLLHRAQELQIVKSGRHGIARIVDRPFAPDRPVRPRPSMVLAVAFVLGLVAGVGVVLTRRAFDERAEDPRAIEASTGLPIFLALPHSDREVHLHRVAGRRGRVPLALDAPGDAAAETLRALRSALGFLLKSPPRVVVVSSPSPGVGKTFLCTNLAHLSAAAGQRVLLVDADLRRGELHRHFATARSPGFSDVVQGELSLEQAVRPTATPGLDLLPSGRIRPSPAELLASPRLGEVLAAAAARYDLVVVDTPPILAVADSIPLARAGTLALLVLRARQHSMLEISVALERFARSGVPIHGGVLNDAGPASGAYGRVYEHRSAEATNEAAPSA